jgi:hypothetical protein
MVAYMLDQWLAYYELLHPNCVMSVTIPNMLGNTLLE